MQPINSFRLILSILGRRPSHRRLNHSNPDSAPIGVDTDTLLAVLAKVLADEQEQDQESPISRQP